MAFVDENEEKVVVKKGEKVTGPTKAERIALKVKELEKKYGKGSVMGGNDKGQEVEAISTSSLGLDRALGVGGLPKGRIVEIMGWESSGKTTLAIHVMAEAHKKPDTWCAIVDVEHSFDLMYAKSLGVDLDRLKISQPNSAEEALEIAETFCESGDFDVVVLDSVAALVPQAEKDREMGESSMGKQAILMSQACRKLTPIVAKSKTLMIFINQMREKIGVMFGSPDTTPGGNALKFYASVRLNISRYIGKTDSVVEEGVKLGNKVKVRVAKNKVSPPFRECEFNILYGEGIDKYGELLDMAVDTDVIAKSGAAYSLDGEKLGFGRAAAIKVLRADVIEGKGDLFLDIRKRVIESYVPKVFDEVELKNVEKEGGENGEV